jgi:hypothetical protein
MPTPIYHSGSDGRAFVTAPGGGTASELSVTKWDMEIDGDIKKFDNNKDGRWRQGGTVDASGSMTLHWESANRPSATAGPNIRHGAIMDVQLREDGTDATDPTKSFRLRVIIEKPKASSDFEGILDYECSYMLQSGTVKYPGDA